ncbi:MAG: UTP--glucose-1-phosphate uridylyltransferase GalU [Alphaproteobacteria bacterium]|nr:UTP--glucose-1-phosphate uridylyltransferase GalU [Alphaproteobacteria bacterium]
MRPIRKVVFPVAGMGTRFLPATKAVPKEMLPVVDKPLIQYAVDEAREAGIEQFIFVTGRGKHVIEDHFDHAYELESLLTQRDKVKELDSLSETLPVTGSVSFTRQQKPLGLGHAVWCARHFVGDEPFAVMLPDDLVAAEPGCLSQMVNAYKETGGNIVAVREVPREHTSRYGILSIGKDNGSLVEVTGLVEKPRPEEAPSTLSILGRYILMPQIFSELERHERGAGGEIQLTDAMARLIGKVPFHGLRFKGMSYDCGDKAGFLQATIEIALARPDLGPKVREILKAIKL